MATLQVSGKRSGLIDNTDLLVAAVVIVEVAMGLDYLRAVLLLPQRR